MKFSLFSKLPRAGKTVSWHQDASYWPISPAKIITVWLAIDTAEAENACMRFIPETHLKRHLTYHPSKNDESNLLFQTVPNAEKFGKPINVELEAGEISLHSNMLLHGSKANNSDRRRYGLTSRYRTAEVRARDSWGKKGRLWLDLILLVTRQTQHDQPKTEYFQRFFITAKYFGI